MFGRKKQIFIEGFGKVECKNGGFFETKIDLWDNLYDIKLYIEADTKNGNFTEKQKNAFKDYKEKRKELQGYIESYYIENYDEIIEDYYIAYNTNWKASCRAQKEFEEIINSYNAENKEALKLLLSYFQPQSILFAKNGDCALVGFIAAADDQGIAITISPKLEIMTQDEFYDEHQSTFD